jgi:phenylacetate-CoA ligase
MSRAEAVYQRSPAWVQNLLLNVHACRIDQHRYGRAYTVAVEGFLRQERWEAERIREFQLSKIQHIVRYAYERSAYYRHVMNEIGVYPDDIKDISDLALLPLLTKDTIRTHSQDLLTEFRPRRDWLHGHTSGTTGSPLGIWYDRETCVINNAVDRQHKIWAGMQHDDWLGLFLGRAVVPIRRTRPPYWRVNRVHRQVWFSSFHLSEENLHHYIAEIKRRQLHFLEGYPSTLYILARFLLQRGEVLPMRRVITSSETLHTLQREAIEQAFACRLRDFYALAERVIYAGECGYQAGKHLADTYGYTEIVDEHGQPVPDGQPGFLVGTSLFNTAMPMIRYRTGDVSAMVSEACSCGRTLRRIRNVATKAEDIIVTPDGQQIVASQIVQDRIDHLLVKLVPATEFTADQERALVSSLQQRLGEGIEIEVRMVDEIPREQSGKFRWVISRVEHSCALRWDDQEGGVSALAAGRPVR